MLSSPTTQPTLPPPRNFKPAGAVRHAEFLTERPSFIRRDRTRGAKAAGQRYERLVHEAFMESHFDHYIPSPWIFFVTTNRQPRYCQPDALLIDLPDITIIEIKLKHCPAAYWQLHRLYLPVIQALFPTGTFYHSCLEICRYLDPETPFPVPFEETDEPLQIPRGSTGVMQWTP